MVYVPIAAFTHDDPPIELSLGSAILEANKANGTMSKQDDKTDWVYIILPLIIIALPVIVCLLIVIFGGVE